MKNTKAVKLTLETDYTINGNSTGCALDTLAIAVDGRDSNDIDEYQDGAHEAEQYVLEHYDYEADMLKQATKAELKQYLKDPQAQAEAVDLYKEKAQEALASNSEDVFSNKSPYKALAVAIQKARDDQADQNYKEWLYGDHRDWAGILRMAERRYFASEGCEFTTDKGEVYTTISEEQIGWWYHDNAIENTTKKAAYQYLQEQINSDARAAYNKRHADDAKRKAERERTQAYKAERAKADEVERQAKLKKLLAKAKK